ncbi:MAG TPA: GTPase HflX [Terriglobia bacterium]|nr:GTPase HflX [Terriglobia bacterium]
MARRCRAILLDPATIAVMEAALLVTVNDSDDTLAELRELAITAGARVVDEFVQRRDHPDPATYIGKGKVDQLRQTVLAESIDVVIFDDELSPSQARNLEEALETKVVDRTGLILDIFARRAQTKEGKLQVELAQWNYRLSRLAGGRSYLSRLGGGIGTRGPGETKLEMDRRQIRHRIAVLGREIEAIRKHRQLHRDRRRRDRLPLVSLVGYTNAGKSTLFQALSGETTLVSSRMFSTLDPLIRKIRLGGRRSILISDTVGFIRKLPHQLVSAFRATLEEVVQADLILHVIDSSDDDRDRKREVVLGVLKEIGAGANPVLTVYSKADLLAETDVRRAATEGDVLVSARNGDGLDQLVDRLIRALPDWNPSGSPDAPELNSQ